MSMMKFPYHNAGIPMSWTDGPPYQSKAAEAQSLGGLGSLGDPTLSMPLPRPGAPEPLAGDCGCGCGGSCGGGREIEIDVTPLLYVAAGFLLAKIFAKG